MFGQRGTIVNSIQPQIWKYISNTPNIHIIGGFFYKIKVSTAIKIIRKIHNNFTVLFPARFIISSQRVFFDRDLFILYLNNSLRPKQMIEIFLCLITKGSLEEIDTHQKYSSGIINKLNRRFFRVSIEYRIEEAAINIANSPPRGKVATEDQHFLMMIMRLKMFIRKISRKIECHSIISLLIANRKLHKKKLRRLHRKNINSFSDKGTLYEQEIISEIDSLIHDKQLLLQRRLIKRAISGIEKWQITNDKQNFSQVYATKLEEIKIEIYRSIKYLSKKAPVRNSIIAKLQEKYHKRQLICLHRKKIKYNYFSQIVGKQQDFIDRLRFYFKEYHYSALIPNSFMESLEVRYFNVIRFTINLFFIGFYAYLIKVPLLYLPFFLALGLFVFQPVSNKFAVLFMLPFVKNSGLKRLSFHELKNVIDTRAGQGKYLCAIDLPIYTGKSTELETTIHYINRNLNNFRNTVSYYKNLGIIYQITSNTADPQLIDQEIEIIKIAQDRADRMYGKNCVFFIYLHRKSSIAKKVGNIIASHLFKFHGITNSAIYTDSGKFFTTFDKGPVFDRAYGNFSASLCANDLRPQEGELDNEKIIKDIINGKTIPISKKIEFTFFVDNKNEIKPFSLEKGLSILLHPENANICILQPQMSIEDPIHEDQKLTSAFLRMMRIARDTHNFRYLKTLHGIYKNMSAYYGKGMIRLASYDYMVMNEVLNLKYVDSHDWQESVFNYSVFCAGSDKRIAIKHIGKNRINLLIDTENDSNMVRLSFIENDCIITNKNGDHRVISLKPGSSEEERIWQVVNFLDNNMEVGERELISTIGNYIRDMRWLKGDLQMFNTFYPYARYMPPYHKFHLGNIFRRFTNESALLIWVFINLLLMSILSNQILLESEVVFVLSLHLAVTAFGIAGIDLFLYPISFELENQIHGISRNYLRKAVTSAIKVIKKIGVGLWQFPLYLLIAWPRTLLGINSTIRIIFAGIDQPINWGSSSNAAISAEEVSESGIPFKKFIGYYLLIICIGVFLWITLLFFVLQRYLSSSILGIFNLGIIILSLIFGPFVSYAISRKIQVK